MYWRRGRTLDKAGERVVLLVCGAGTYIGCVDNVKCEWITKWREDNTIRFKTL